MSYSIGMTIPPTEVNEITIQNEVAAIEQMDSWKPTVCTVGAAAVGVIAALLAADYLKLDPIALKCGVTAISAAVSGIVGNSFGHWLNTHDAEHTVADIHPDVDPERIIQESRRGKSGPKL